MKKKLHFSRKLLSILFCYAVSYIGLTQTTYVPDGYFENALINLGYDDVLDDYVLTANINSITVLDISNNSISDLTGIEDFISLTHFNCASNNLSSIDISNCSALMELDCSNNNLTTLNVSSNTALETLRCYLNDIVNLDLSSNTALEYLSCYSNDLTALDVSNNTLLTYFSSDYNFGITSLDFTNNTALSYISCFANGLTSLNVSSCTLLTDLYCDTNSLTSLNLSNNTLLIHLQAHDNDLTSLDLSNNTHLQDITCQNNNISVLDINNNVNLIYLSCYSNSLSSLDTSNNLLLSNLQCQYNNIGILELNNNAELAYLRCHNNALTSLNVKNGNNSNVTYFNALNNPLLQCIEVDDVTYSDLHWLNIDAQSYFSLDCPALLTYVPDDAFEQALIDQGYDDVLDNYVLTTNINAITSLYVAFEGIDDLTGIEAFTGLNILTCNNNNLISLDVSNNLALTDLFCYTNNLTVLDVSLNPALKALSCSDNSLTSLNAKNGNNTNFTFFNAINNPDLYCIEVDNPLYSEANWSNIDTQSYFSQDCALSVKEDALNHITLYPNPITNYVTVDLKNLFQLKTIKVYNIAGNLVAQTNKPLINLESLRAGFYILQIETNKGITCKKLIKH